MQKILVLEENEITERLVSSILNSAGYDVALSKGMYSKDELDSVDVVIIDADNNNYQEQRDLISDIKPLITICDNAKGLVDFVTKPISPEKLLSKVKKSIDLNDSADPSSSDHRKFMQRAIDISLEKMLDGHSGPFGAVVVKHGKIIGEGWDNVLETNDPTGKAIVMAIRTACNKINSFSLEGCYLYSNVEPEPMSLAAIYWAKVDKVFYANTRLETQEIGFDDEFIYRQILEKPSNRAMPIIRLEKMADAAYDIFRQWLEKEDKTEY